MGHAYAHLHRIPTSVFRFFTVYGPWGRPDMALFKFADAILHDRPIEVYGEGRLSRDFTYVDDLVEGIVRLIEIPPDESNRVEGIDTLSRHAPFRIVNIGGGQPVKLPEFIAAVERALGKRARVEMLPMQPGDVPQTFASADLLRALTGFVPQTSIDSGVAEFVKWFVSWRRERGIEGA